MQIFFLPPISRMTALQKENLNAKAQGREEKIKIAKVVLKNFYGKSQNSYSTFEISFVHFVPLATLRFE